MDAFDDDPAGVDAEAMRALARLCEATCDFEAMSAECLAEAAP